MQNTHVLLMGGSDSTYHDFSVLLPLLGGFLREHGLVVTTSTDPDLFLPENIRRFDLVLCCTFGHTLTAEQEAGLLDAVQGDPWDESAKLKGFLGLHGAAGSFLNSEGYLRMLGGKFLVHPPLDTLEVNICRPDHPVMEGVSDFSIEDELYLIETYAPFKTLAAVDYGGFSRPVVWVKPYGLGRVVYLSLGHGEKQLKNQSFQQILINAVRWILDP